MQTKDHVERMNQSELIKKKSASSKGSKTSANQEAARGEVSIYYKKLRQCQLGGKSHTLF